jgi:L-asparaginase II
MPLREIAWLYARLELLAPRPAAAMRAHPAMVAGTGEFDTVLMGTLPGVVSKGGAEALQTICLPEQGLGVAVRIEDGAFRALDPAVMAVLTQLLGWQALPGSLERFALPPLLSARGETVGELRADLRLTSQSA